MYLFASKIVSSTSQFLFYDHTGLPCCLIKHYKEYVNREPLYLDKLAQ